MDLKLYSRVLFRFKYLVLAGLLLACALMFFSVFQVSLAHGFKVSYRQNQTFLSEEQLYLNTQGGVPFRTTTAKTDPKTGAVYYPPNLVPPSSLGSTAILYAKLVNSDLLAHRVGHLPGTYVALALSTSGNQPINLPFLAIDGYGTSPKKAIFIANRVSNAFMGYVTQNQAAANVPDSQRVLLTVSTKASTASVSTGRRYTVPIIVFLVVLIATLGLAFILESLRPTQAVRVPENVDDSQALKSTPAAAEASHDVDSDGHPHGQPLRAAQRTATSSTTTQV